jgi:hypothetical protein
MKFSKFFKPIVFVNDTEDNESELLTISVVFMYIMTGTTSIVNMKRELVDIV